MPPGRGHILLTERLLSFTMHRSKQHDSGAGREPTLREATGRRSLWAGVDDDRHAEAMGRNGYARPSQHSTTPVFHHSSTPSSHPCPRCSGRKKSCKTNPISPCRGWTPEAKRAKRTQFPSAGGWAPEAKCAKRTQFPPAGDGRRRQNVRNEPNFPLPAVGTGGKTCETNPISLCRRWTPEAKCAKRTQFPGLVQKRVVLPGP
jgi:hypothetical protein